MKKFISLIFTALISAMSFATTYTVAGNSTALFGTSWDPTNVANDMKAIEGEGFEDQWSITYKNVTLPAGVIEFKVVMDHNWNDGKNAWPSENYKYTIESSGIYLMTITFNSKSHVVGCRAAKQGDADVDPKAAVLGSWDEWKASTSLVLSEDKKSASQRLTLDAKDYEFKIVLNDGDWRANGHEYHREYTGAENISGNGDNMKLKADVAGEYVFTWTFATNGLSIEFPKATAIENTAVEAATVKTIENGMLVIRKGDVRYNVLGQIVR